LPSLFEIEAWIEQTTQLDFAIMKVMLFTLATISGMLAACTTTAQVASAPQGDPIARSCRSGAAARLVGQAAPDDAVIEHRTGAELIRRIARGDAVTDDFRENRITLAIDPAGKVVEATCG
jgi:hypothetical protein